MTAREPLAALVAALVAEVRDWLEGGARPEGLSSGLRRLLAAVEAGTKCADAIATVLRSGPDAISGGRAEFRGVPERGIRGSAITISFDEMRAALDEWNRIVAPASHGSPEQGR